MSLAAASRDLGRRCVCRYQASRKADGGRSSTSISPLSARKRGSLITRAGPPTRAPALTPPSELAIFHGRSHGGLSLWATICSWSSRAMIRTCCASGANIGMRRLCGR
jgi:hypothetical protein